MNLLFQTRKPRGFHHEMIYCDERRERLQLLERRAKQELGMKVDSKSGAYDLHGTILATRHEKAHRRSSGNVALWALALLLLLAFVALAL